MAPSMVYILSCLMLHGAHCFLMEDDKFAVFLQDASKTLDFPAVDTRSVTNQIQCSQFCLQNDRCLSYNMATERDRLSSSYLCELLPSDKYSTNAKLSPNATFSHYSLLDVCLDPSFCPRNSTCVPNNKKNTYHCACYTQGYTGKNCEIDIDECASSPCTHSGSCSDQLDGFHCTCAPGFTGITCQTNINECLSGPCRNGGSCNDAINGYTCDCVPGYTGTTCETDINECLVNPCLAGGVCTDLVNGYSCDCLPGFTGHSCETDINDCATTPCGVNGECLDQVNAYKCICSEGFTGLNCQTAIVVDDCVPNPCHSNAPCTSTASGFTCKCPDGRFGEKCQLP